MVQVHVGDRPHNKLFAFENQLLLLQKHRDANELLIVHRAVIWDNVKLLDCTSHHVRMGIIFFVISRIRFPVSISISPSLFAWFYTDCTSKCHEIAQLWPNSLLILGRSRRHHHEKRAAVALICRCVTAFQTHLANADTAPPGSSRWWAAEAGAEKKVGFTI